MSGTDTLPREANADIIMHKVRSKKGQSVSTIIVLRADPSLLYMLGYPEDLAVVWRKL